jgi:hypothetical protein
MSTDKNRDALVRIAKTYIPREVRKEYREFIEAYHKAGRNQLDLVLDQSLKITFIREMDRFIENEGPSDDAWLWLFFNTEEGHILDATWKRYESNELTRDNNGFIEQLLDFSHKNEERVSMRIEEAKRCQIGQRQICR